MVGLRGVVLTGTVSQAGEASLTGPTVCRFGALAGGATDRRRRGRQKRYCPDVSGRPVSPVP